MLSKRNLWSAKFSEEDCAGKDSSEVIYNLYEDICCLKEDIQHWRDINWRLLEANRTLIQAAKMMLKYEQDNNRK